MQGLTQGQGSQTKSPCVDTYKQLENLNEIEVHSPTGKGTGLGGEDMSTQNVGNFLIDENSLNRKKNGFDANTTQTNALLSIEDD